MNPRPTLRTLFFVLLLSGLFLMPPLSAKAGAETRITVTVAAGGVACGIFFFFHYGLRVSLSAWHHQAEPTALFTLDPEGGQIRFPTLSLLESEHRGITAWVPAPERLQIDLLKWRF